MPRKQTTKQAGAKSARASTKQVRVISGTELESFSIRSGLTSKTTHDLLGLSKTRFKAEAGKVGPIKDATLAILIRMYHEHPEQLPSPDFDIREFYAAIGGREAVSPADFSLILGREGSAYTRWFSGTNTVSPTLERLITLAMRIEGGNPKRAFSLIKKLSVLEANSRETDPMHTRSWMKKERPEKSKATKKPAK